jgi:hypothetical protein
MLMRVSSSRSQKLCLRVSENCQPEGRCGQSSRNVDAGCDGRVGVERASLSRGERRQADGEDVWSWHPWAGAKLAGDDLPATVTMRSRTPGRARTTPLTPLRREGRVAPVEPVVNNSCAFYTAHEAAGATSIRSSLRPCVFRGAMSMQNSGELRRENARGCPDNFPSLRGANGSARSAAR